MSQNRGSCSGDGQRGPLKSRQGILELFVQLDLPSKCSLAQGLGIRFSSSDVGGRPHIAMVDCTGAGRWRHRSKPAINRNALQ